MSPYSENFRLIINFHSSTLHIKSFKVKKIRYQSFHEDLKACTVMSGISFLAELPILVGFWEIKQRWNTNLLVKQFYNFGFGNHYQSSLINRRWVSSIILDYKYCSEFSPLMNIPNKRSSLDKAEPESIWR